MTSTIVKVVRKTYFFTSIDSPHLYAVLARFGARGSDMDVPLRLKYIVIRYGYRESKSPQRFAKSQTL